jgi:acetoin utilization deacetylase AcuC-like enzyme
VTGTLLLRDERFLAHDAGPGHPENAGRLAAVHADLDANPPAGVTVEHARAATREQLLLVHTAEHVDRVEATAGVAHSQLDPDTGTCADSAEIARLAAGAVLRGVEAAVSGEAQGALALVRPPGHHAEPGAAMGFCLYNNVAVAAAHATDALGCRRVLVLDPDIHHGNGTQHAFESRDDVLYVSSHRFPFYPGTGWVDEVGTGDGAGFTINMPLPMGMGDPDLMHCYREVVAPVVHAWKPDLILVSAGFDTWKDDPVGDMAVTAEGFAGLFGLFRGWADAHCPGRLVAALEGGYDPPGVVAGVRAALGALTAAQGEEVHVNGEVSFHAKNVSERARRTLAPFWPRLAS